MPKITAESVVDTGHWCDAQPARTRLQYANALFSLGGEKRLTFSRVGLGYVRLLYVIGGQRPTVCPFCRRTI